MVLGQGLNIIELGLGFFFLGSCGLGLARVHWFQLRVAYFTEPKTELKPLRPNRSKLKNCPNVLQFCGRMSGPHVIFEGSVAKTVRFRASKPQF